MAKKQTTTAKQENAVNSVPKKKLTKKEKKAIAEQRSKELYQKKMRNYGVGFVFSLIAVAVSFLSKAETGTMVWSYTQIGCYVLMGIAGIFLKNGSKYEENAKRAKTMDMIGLAFIAICIGMIVAEIVAMMTM